MKCNFGTWALIVEAINPGTFQQTLTKSCENNVIPNLKYTLQPDTAKCFYHSITGTQTKPTSNSSNRIKTTTYHTNTTKHNARYTHTKSGPFLTDRIKTITHHTDKINTVKNNSETWRNIHNKIFLGYILLMMGIWRARKYP